MTRTDTTHYFGAGPALLPTSVIKQAAEDLIEYQGSGLGLGEISHRSAPAVAVVDNTKSNIKQLLNVPETHEVFFLQSGGTGEFAAVAYNMLAAFAKKTGKKGKSDYIVTGTWSQKAAEEAKRLGVDVNIVVNGKKSSPTGKYDRIPEPETWNAFGSAEDTAYVYYCDNETVNGVEFPYVPKVPEGVELVADMSSNILSREVDVSKFGVIFAGVQKNIGIAGVAVVIIKKSLLEKPSDEELTALNIPLAPIVFDFPTLVKNNSLYNTLPIFNLHVVYLTTKLLLDNGGLKVQEAVSNKKAEKLYATLDSVPEGVFNLLVEKNSRSRMNIVFTVIGEGKEKEFLDGAKTKGMTGLSGHRSVGGIRISNYNAVSEESIDYVCSWIKEFAS